MKSWADFFTNEFGEDVYTHAVVGSPRIWSIAILDGKALSLLSSMVTSAARKKIPEERHASVLHWSGSVDSLGLELANRYVGHVYLVDNEGRVRWRGRGQATTEHGTRMVEFAKELIAEAADPKQSTKKLGGKKGKH